MKKICFIGECMLCGGTEKSLLSLLPYLDREKYEITLLLLKKNGDLMPFLPDDIEVGEIPLPKEEADDLLIGRISEAGDEKGTYLHSDKETRANCLDCHDFSERYDKTAAVLSKHRRKDQGVSKGI